MKISLSKPPIYDEAKKLFKFPEDHAVFFTYGDTCYNPSMYPMQDHLKKHEETHVSQQLSNNKDAARWWRAFFDDPNFRVHQEAEAYGKQWNHICTKIKDKNRRVKILWELAGQLASPLYGDCVTKMEAVKLIRQYAQGIMHRLPIPNDTGQE